MSAVVELAQRLVRIPGESGQEAEVARLVKETMEEQRFDEVWVDDVGNVLGLIKGTRRRDQRTLLFDAHLDTVGVEDQSAWQYPPYSGEVVNGRLYGRGAVDMRGALAAMIHGLGSIDRSQLAGKVYLSASVCEEVLEGAALQPVLASLCPDAVIIGEATGLALASAQRGRAELLLRVNGRAAHSAWPERGQCAVTAFCRAWLALEELVPPRHARLGAGITVLTDVVSTPYPGRSVVPFLAEATLDRRLLPDEDLEHILAQLTAQAQRVLEQAVSVEVVEGEAVSYTGWPLRQRKVFPAWELAPEHPLLASAQAALKGQGLSGALTHYAFCTNGSASAGLYGIPTIGFGPGDESDAHQADESVAVDQLVAAAQGYQSLALGLNTRPSRQLVLVDG